MLNKQNLPLIQKSLTMWLVKQKFITLQTLPSTQLFLTNPSHSED